MKTVLFFALLGFSCSCQTETPQAEKPDAAAIIKEARNQKTPEEKPAKKLPVSWTFDKIEGQTLTFKEGRRFETGLFELKYIGQIPVDENAPFLIYSGRDCNACDANISLYFHSPRHGQLEAANGANRFAHPGTVADYETNELVFKARTFYGEVLPEVKGMIWFQESLGENNSFVKSVFLAKIENGKIVESEFDNQAAFAQTLALRKAGKNREITPMEFTSEP